MMNEVNDDNIILSNIKHEYISVILFGSYSRSDNTVDSDIDILQVTRKEFKPYSIGRINYSPYTSDQLKKMANNGNLFILHIISEGKIIAGNESILHYLDEEFFQPKSYETLRKDILLACQLLDVSENEYSNNSKGYYNLLCYLFRSYLYSIMVDENHIRFAIKEVSLFFNDSRINYVFNSKHIRDITFEDYTKCKSLFEEYTNTIFTNQFDNTGSLIKSLKQNSVFASAMGIHFLKDSIEETFY